MSKSDARDDSVVQVRGLRKEYGRVVAVAELDLDVPRGSVFGLLGPNGAGKSTTFGILCGWLKATAGSATILGTPSGKLHQLHGRVAALPQDAAFPPQISVRRQLTHFGRMMHLSQQKAEQEADRTLELVGLKDAAKMRGNQLSHGMLKRVGLAQVLVGEPDVIFLDEPTAGLDPKSARQIKDVIASQVPRATVILSSHNLVDVQEICTDGAILDKGRLALGGSIDVLTRRGAEVTFDIKPGAEVPKEKLDQAFGEGQLEYRDERIRLLFDAEEDPSKVIAKALRIFLDADTPILGVKRGTSLETAFLEVTADKDKKAKAS